MIWTQSKLRFDKVLPFVSHQPPDYALAIIVHITSENTLSALVHAEAVTSLTVCHLSAFIGFFTVCFTALCRFTPLCELCLQDNMQQIKQLFKTQKLLQ